MAEEVETYNNLINEIGIMFKLDEIKSLLALISQSSFRGDQSERVTELKHKLQEALKNGQN